jgi:release factor glutamine methyltransferase
MMNVRIEFGIATDEFGGYDVYRPQRLSMALAEGAEKIYRHGDVVAEAFAGCGLAGFSIAALRPTVPVVIADAWPDAISVAKLFSARRNLKAEFVECDVYSCFEDRSLDLLIAAPPAVPSPQPDFWRLSRGMEFATNGGAHGTDVMMRAVREAPRCLRAGGRLVLALPHWCEHKSVLSVLGETFASVKTLLRVQNRLVVCENTSAAGMDKQLGYLFALMEAGVIELSVDEHGRISSEVSIVSAEI